MMARRHMASSRPLTRDKASVAVVLFMTCLILFDDHDRVFALLFSPTNNTTYRPVLDAPSGKFAYDASVKATILRSSTVPKLGNTSFDSLFLIFWIILFASIKWLTTGFLLMSQVKFKTSKDISGRIC